MRSTTFSLPLLLLLGALVAIRASVNGNPNLKSVADTENYVRQYLTKISPKLLQHCTGIAYSTWALHLNPHDKEVQEKSTSAQAAYDDFLHQIKVELTKYSWRSFKDDNLKKHVERVITDSSPLPSSMARKYTDLIQSLELKKELAKNKMLEDEPEIDETRMSAKAYFNKVFLRNKNSWKQFYNGLGKQFKAEFPEFVALSKEYLKNSYVTKSDATTSPLYDEIMAELKPMQQIWEEDLFPFFQQLHAYVRGTLKILYGRHISKSDQLIPISLIGRLESWLDVYGDSIPFETVPSRDDITEALLVKMNVSTVDIYREVEEYFISLNLPPMQGKFWTDSVFEQPQDKEVICTNALHTFCFQNESRVLECDGVSYFTLTKAYRSLGSAKLHMLIKNMDYFPLPELDEVVNEAMNVVWLLFGSNPERFRRMYLLEPNPNLVGSLAAAAALPLTREEARKRKNRNAEINTNFQHAQALYIIPELANILSTQTWWWRVYNGNYTNETLWNCEYWKVRGQYEGVAPALRRSKKHFDPFWLMSPTTYKSVQKFVAYLLAFQIHKSLCITAGEYEEVVDPNSPIADAATTTSTTTPNPMYVKYPKVMYEKRGGPYSYSRGGGGSSSGQRKLLRNCDITDSKAVGNKLRKLAASGALSDWRKTLKFFTGSEELSTGPLLEYFKPYITWLTDYTKKTRFPVGWKPPKGKVQVTC